MRKLLITFIFAMIFLSSSVLAQEVYQYSVNVEIDDDVSYDVNIILVNYTSNSFSLMIPGSPQDININSSIYCAQKDTTWGKEIRCDISRIMPKATIDLTYRSDSKIMKKDSYFIFSDYFTMPENIDKFSLMVKMPEGTGLVEKDQAFSPEGALIGSDGRQSFLYWSHTDVAKGEKFDVSVAYERIGIFNYSIVGFPVIIIIILILAVVFFKYFLKQKPVKIILPVLKQDEKLIFETLIKHEPGINQKVIVRESGYSKAKVSKVLKNLQERGLLKLERIGRTNKIHYDVKFRKKD